MLTDVVLIGGAAKEAPVDIVRLKLVFFVVGK